MYLLVHARIALLSSCILAITGNRTAESVSEIVEFKRPGKLFPFE